MLRSSYAGARVLATAAALWLLAIASACGKHTAPETRGGETHWLSSCFRDSDCGEGGMCLCGICSASCEARSACEHDAVAADCRPVDAPGLAQRCSALAAETRAICVAVCDAETRCPSGTSCEDGICLPEAAAIPRPDGGPMQDNDGGLPDASGPEDAGGQRDGAPAPTMDGGDSGDATVGGSADAAMPDPNQPVVIALPPPDRPSPVRADTCDYGRPPGDVVLVSTFVPAPPATATLFDVTESDVIVSRQVATACTRPLVCTWETHLSRTPRCGGETVMVGEPLDGIVNLIGVSAGRAFVRLSEMSGYRYSVIDLANGEATELFVTEGCVGGQAVSEDHVVLADACQDKLLLLSRESMRFESIADVIDPGVVAIGTDIAYVATEEGVRWVVLTSGETGLLTDLKDVFGLSADEHAVVARTDFGNSSGGNERVATLIQLEGGAVRTWTGAQQLEEPVPRQVIDGYVYSQRSTPEGPETWRAPSGDSTASPRRVVRREANLLRPWGERLYWLEERGSFLMTTIEEAERASHTERSPAWSERFVAHDNPLQMAAALAPGGDIVAVTTTEGHVDLGGGEVAVGFDEAVVARFDREGQLRWQKVVEGQSLEQQIAVASDGTIALAGVAHVSRLSAEGEPIFTQPLPPIARRLLAVDGAGGTYLAELAEGGASALVALDAAGDERWRRTLTAEGPGAPVVVSLAASGAGALVAIAGVGSTLDFGDGPFEVGGGGTVVALFGPDGALRFWRLVGGATAEAQFGPDGIVAIGQTPFDVYTEHEAVPVPQAGELYAFTLAIDLDGTVHTPKILDIAGAWQGRVTADGGVYFLARGPRRPVPALVDGYPVFVGSDIYQPYLVVRVTPEGAIGWTGLVDGTDSAILSADDQGAVVAGIIRQESSIVDGYIAAY